MSKLITAIFKTRSSAMLATEDLIRHNYSQDDISLLMSETTRGKEFAIRELTKTPEGFATGAAIGGVLGALICGMTGVGLVAFPGMAFYAAGQWVCLLAGFGAGVLGGGIIGGLVGNTAPKHEADLCKADLESGSILLGLYVADEKRAEEARKLVEANSALHCRVESVKEERLQKTPNQTA